MENKAGKGIDNKKLAKILAISGFALLILFIIIRIAFKANGDRVIDMPTVGELHYEPQKIKEQSKVEQFEEQKKEKERKEMGFEDQNNYVVPNFNSLTEQKQNTTPSGNSNNLPMTTNPSVQPVPQSSYQNPNTNQQNNNQNLGAAPQQTTTAPGSKLSYQSEYFKTKKEEQPVQQQAPVNTAPVSRNPFGTISTDNISGQKQTISPASFYTAEIYGDQKIENGGNVLIRNTEPVQYLNLNIPRNSILYGQAAFQGNRVFVRLNRVKTPSGEFPISLSVQDNDRIEGLYYKAPIDETVDNTKNETNIPVPGKYGGVVNKVAESVIKSGKDLMKKAQSLNLEEGYKIFLIPIKSN